MRDGSVRTLSGFHVTWRTSLRRDSLWPCENIQGFPRSSVVSGGVSVNKYSSTGELPRLHADVESTSNARWQKPEGAGSMNASLRPKVQTLDGRKDASRRRHSQRRGEYSVHALPDRSRVQALGQSQSEPSFQRKVFEADSGILNLPVLADEPQGGGNRVRFQGKRGSPNRRASAESQFEKVHLPVLLSRGYAGVSPDTQRTRRRHPERTLISEKLERNVVLPNRSEAGLLEALKTSESSSPKRKFLASQLHHTALQDNPIPRSPRELVVPKKSSNVRAISPFDHGRGSLALQEISSIASRISIDLEHTRKHLEERKWLNTVLTENPEDIDVPEKESGSSDIVPSFRDSQTTLKLPTVKITTPSPPSSGRLYVPEKSLPVCGVFASKTTPRSFAARSRSASPPNSGRSIVSQRSTPQGGRDRVPVIARRPVPSPPGSGSKKLRTPPGGSARQKPGSSQGKSSSGTGGTNEENPDITSPMVSALADSTGDVAISVSVAHESSKRDMDDEVDPVFNEDGILRMRGAFFRFTEPYSADFCIDNLSELLKYLGHQVTNATAKGVMELVKSVSIYEYLNFDEFLQFMEKYIAFEREQFRIEFEKADEDDSGELSVLELREVMKSLGIPPLNAMVREAVKHVDKDYNGQLDFDEFMTFLNVYRYFEGFTGQEVADLHKAYNHFAGDGVFHSSSLSPALVLFFGRHVAAQAKNVEKGLLERMKLEGRVDTSLTFEDLLLLARRVRETFYEGVQQGVVSRTTSALHHHEHDHQKKYHEFTGADLDKNNTISEKELKKALRELGYEPLASVLEEIYEEILEEGWESIELDFDQYFDFLLVYRRREGFLKAQVDEMQAVFQQFDEDGSESISSLELDDIFRYLGYSLSMDDIHHYLHIVDDDQSNELDFREFLHLMQLHRCSEIQEMRQKFKIQLLDEAALQKTSTVLELPKTRVIDILAASGYEDVAESLVISDSTKFDAFVALADQCRTVFVAKERRKAGYTEKDIKQLRESFDTFDTDNSGTIDCSELAKVLEFFGWKPQTRQERDDLLGRLDKARILAKEAGVQEVTPAGSAEVSFWEFIQLKRMIQRHEDTAREEVLHKLMKELKFSTTETEEFREIFRSWVQNGEEEELDEESPTNAGSAHDQGNISKRAVRQQVRSLSGKLSPDRRRSLENQLNELDEDNAGLDFEGFLRLMRWLLDSHFMDHVFNKAEKT